MSDYLQIFFGKMLSVFILNARAILTIATICCSRWVCENTTSSIDEILSV
jgi:hypothetical protein